MASAHVLARTQIPSAAQVAARIDKLHSIPEAVQRVIKAIDGGKADSNQISRIMEEDPPLSARILSVANSGFYSRLSKVETVTEAITRIGYADVRKLAMACMVGNLGGEGEIFKHLYVHSLASAEVAEVVRKVLLEAKAIPPVGPVFTAGLLHDVGLFALFQYIPDVMDRCIEAAKVRDLPLNEVEAEVLGYTHCDVGSLLLQRWRLGQREVEAAKWHHAAGNPQVTCRADATILTIADLVVTWLGVSKTFRLTSPNVEKVVDTLGIAPLWPTILTRAPEAISRAEGLAILLAS